MGMFAQKERLGTEPGPEADLPSLCPSARLVEPHCFRKVALFKKEAVSACVVVVVVVVVVAVVVVVYPALLPRL